MITSDGIGESKDLNKTMDPDSAADANMTNVGHKSEKDRNMNTEDEDEMPGAICTAETRKVVASRGGKSWATPTKMYDDIEDQLQIATSCSSKQVSDERKDRRETPSDKENSSSSLQHSSDDRNTSKCKSSRMDGEKDHIRHQRKECSKYSERHDKEEYRYNDRSSRERSQRCGDRRRSQSAENRNHHYRSRDESARHKRQRSKSRSRERSQHHSSERNNEQKDQVGKTAADNEGFQKVDSWSGKNVYEDRSNGESHLFNLQFGTEGTCSKKERGQGHLHGQNDASFTDRSKEKVRNWQEERHQPKSPSTDRYDQADNDRTGNKRCRSSSFERDKRATSREKQLFSDQKHRRQRTRSRSGSRSSRRDRHHGQSHSRRRRSRSREDSRAAYSRNRSRSLSRNNDARDRSESEKRPRSRTKSREREAGGVGDNWLNMQKRSSEEDRDKCKRRRSRSKSVSKQSYEYYASKDRERRRRSRSKESKEHVKNWRETDQAAVTENSKRYRSRSKSAEKAWNSSNWKERRKHRDEYSHDYSSNSGGWSGYTQTKFLNNKFYHGRRDRWNSWSRGNADDTKMSRESSRGNFVKTQWHDDLEFTENDERRWSQDRKPEVGLKQDDKDYEEQGSDDGHQLEDMVTKSLAKLRQDSDKEHHTGDNNLENVPGDPGANEPDADGNVRDNSRSAIPVLLSKKSYKTDSYKREFDYNSSNRENFKNESDSLIKQQRDRQEPRFFNSKGRRLPIGQPRFTNDFRQPMPARIDFHPRGKPPMPPSVTLLPTPPVGVGTRLPPPAIVQPGVIISPFHIRPPGLQEVPLPVDWHVVGSDNRMPAVFSVAHPPPAPVGPRGQLVPVGGFIRTQVPVEFLTRHSVPDVPVHPSSSAFQARFVQAHSMPPLHPGAPLQQPPVRTHLQGDPRHIVQPPVTFVRSHLQVPDQNFRQRLVDIRHLPPPPGLMPPHTVPTLNIAFPPPPLPVNIATSQGNNSLSFQTSTHVRDTCPNSPPTPPPPPPPAILPAPLDPRLNSVKLLNRRLVQQPIQHSPSSTSDESLEDAGFSSQHGSLHHKENPNTSWSSPLPPERPNSASSVGSNYSPPNVLDDDYAEALFAEPYHRPLEESNELLSNRKSEVFAKPDVIGSWSTTADFDKVTASGDTVDAPIAEEYGSQMIPNDDYTYSVQKTVNVLDSPADDFTKSPVSSGNALNVSAGTLQMVQVDDLKKVLETVRTSAISIEEEPKSSDKGNRMDQIAEEVKLALKPYFGKSLINKEEYKDIMRRAVPKIFSSKSTLDRGRIQSFVQEYVNKIVKARKSDKAKRPTSQSCVVSKHSSKVSSKAT